MKAYILHGINDIRLEETAVPRIREDEVLVRVKAAGICGSDIPRIYVTGTYSYPLALWKLRGEKAEGHGREKEWASIP